MNPADYFKEGSEGYVQTKQAIDIINAGREAGLPNMDQYENDLKASIGLAKQSGWKQWDGFDSNRKVISSLVPQIQSVVQSKNDYNKLTSGISTTLGTAYALGVDVPPTIRDGITRALEMEDAPRVKIFDDTLQALIKARGEEKTAPKPKDQVGAEELSPFEQQRVYNLAAMKLKSQGEFKDNEEFNRAVALKLSNPDEFGKLATEAKKRDMVETQARKVFRRLQAARELYASPELMNEFGDMKPTNWPQGWLNTRDHSLHAALLEQLKGGDLAQGMAEVKSATGTAAGMAVEETKALAASISALKSELAPEDAQKKVLQVINDAKFTLERLGIDPELIKDKTSGDRVLANEIKYLLPDERSFNMGRSTTSRGVSAETEALINITEGLKNQSMLKDKAPPLPLPGE